MPDCQEKVLRPWKTIAYGRPAPGRKFCAISPHMSWVNLQFHEGAALADPAGLLEGTGKSMRHVKLPAPAEVRRRPGAALAVHSRGMGTCGTCAVQIEGPVSEPTHVERLRLRLPPHTPESGLRLACQCSVLGDIQVTKHAGLFGQREDVETAPGGR